MIGAILILPLKMVAGSVSLCQWRDRRCYFSLVCTIGSFGLACTSLLQLTAFGGGTSANIGNSEQRISWQRGLFLTSLGFVHFMSMVDFCHKSFLETSRGHHFRQKYQLVVSDVMDISNKWVWGAFNLNTSTFLFNFNFNNQTAY